MSLLSVSRLSKKIGNSVVVKSVSFSVVASQKIAIAGETGSGKSTLLKMIAGLVQPDSGSVLFENDKVKGPDEVLVPGHPSIAYLSQLFELPKFLRVEQVLEYANSLTEKQATKLFRLCHIQHLLKRKTDELSGGEKQRVALARQLLSQPRLLLLDEPYSNLDILHKNTLKKVIDNLIDEVGITCILVSHDPLDTLSFADEVLVLHKGKVVQNGTPSAIYKQPLNEYVAGLFGSYMLLEPKELRTLGRSGSKKTTIVRPEDFVVSVKAKGVKGLVKKVSYFGGYKEISIDMMKKSFLIKISSGVTIESGDSVQVSLK